MTQEETPGWVENKIEEARVSDAKSLDLSPESDQPRIDN
jgi:hypothetical protein